MEDDSGLAELQRGLNLGVLTPFPVWVSIPGIVIYGEMVPLKISIMRRIEAVSDDPAQMELLKRKMLEVDKTDWNSAPHHYICINDPVIYSGA